MLTTLQTIAKAHGRFYFTAVIAAFFLPTMLQAEDPTWEKTEKIQDGFQFTEGPTYVPGGNLYFSDIPAEKIYQLDSSGQITEFTSTSHHTNGIMYDPSSATLIACEMDGQVVRRSLDNSEDREVLAGKYKGNRFNAPNDLVIDQQGGIYFTDPSFRAPEPMPQDTLGVYYRRPNGKIIRVVEDLPNPNGIILSPDETKLYVIPSGQAEMMVYPVKSPGKVGKGKVFCTLKQAEGQSGRGGDGLTIDTQGNLYITSGLGLQVFRPDGSMVGIVEVPEKPANVTFGGPENSTLFITARTGLYRAQTTATGHQFGQK
ncbi:Glutathione peroxidase [Planctomycetales bacterium 10988]|nr:Glutathione peroxidase [Planctomycetales bacterium 10988]